MLSSVTLEWFAHEEKKIKWKKRTAAGRGRSSNWSVADVFIDKGFLNNKVKIKMSKPVRRS